MESRQATRLDIPHPRGRPVRVYLLDGHELMRRGLRTVLAADPGVEVVGESGSAREATARIPALRPDVALLRAHLPDGSGVEVCRAVRTTDPRIRVLVITGCDDDEARSAATLAGACGSVLTRIPGQHLLAAVHRAAAGESVVDLPGSRAPGCGASRMERVRLGALTPQERRVVDLVVDGLTNAEIGRRLGIRETTVRNHVSNLLAKLGVSSRTQAAVYLLRHQH